MKLTKELVVRIASFIYRVLGCVLNEYADKESADDEGRCA